MLAGGYAQGGGGGSAPDLARLLLCGLSCPAAGMLTAKDFEDRAVELQKGDDAAVMDGEPSELPPGLLEGAGCEHLSERWGWRLRTRASRLVRALTLCASPCPPPPLAGAGTPHFALGMCKDCCLSFVKTTGGVAPGAANPPAYERARQREEEELALLLEGPGERWA